MYQPWFEFESGSEKMELLLASPAQLYCKHCVCMQNDLIDAAAVVQYSQFGVAELLLPSLPQNPAGGF